MSSLLDMLDVEDLVKIALLLAIALLAVKLVGALFALVVGAFHFAGPAFIFLVAVLLALWFLDLL